MKLETYNGPGKGIVFQDEATTERVEKLFRTENLWSSKDLNELVGWQFSQAVFYLRRRGWKIETVREPGTRNFFYKVLSIPA